MVVTILGVLAIAIGIILIYISPERESDKDMWITLIFGLLLVVSGGWLFITTIGIEVLLKKFVGLIVMLFGFFMLKGFPDIASYQGTFKNTAITVGLICFALGFYMLFF